MKIWSAVTGDEILTIDHPQELSWPVVFSDGAEVLAACDADKTAVAYDSQTGQLRRIFKLSDRAFRFVRRILQMENIVLGEWRNELKVFDTRSGTFLAKFEADGEFHDIQFVPNSKALLIQFTERPLKLCSIQG